MTNNSSVSVIIPVYNGERFLREAIQSVLDQTYRPSELIVVDDGSDDQSAQIAKSFGPLVELLSQPNRGPGEARNAGIRKASGEFLAFLDADDIWLKDKLEKQMAEFSGDNFIDAVFCHMKMIQEELSSQSVPGYHMSSMLIKMKSFIKIGEFETGWKFAEVVEWLARAKDMGLKIQLIPETLVHRRIHGDNMTMRGRKFFDDYAKVARKIIERRRKA